MHIRHRQVSPNGTHVESISMGKGTIISGGTAGEYTVTVDYDRTKITAELSRLTAQIALLEEAIGDLDPDDEQVPILQLRKSSYELRQDALQNLPDDPQVANVWCGDFTENLTGEVGLIEIAGAGDRSEGLNIQPGYNANAAYDGDRDGALQFTLATTPAAAFYNLAMFPGWQKWMPLYMYGVISNLDTDNDTCDVTLDAVTSSQQSLDVVANSVLTTVPISYMNCNAAAFSNDDHVLVEFIDQDYEDPQVVGFFSDPVPCLWEPWGATICAYKSWSVEYYNPFSETNCPAFPTGDWTLELAGSNYSVKCDMIIAGSARTTALSAVTANNVGGMPDIDNTPYMKVKVTASGPSNTHFGSWAKVEIRATGGNKTFWFYYARGDFGVSGNNIYVGDNGGAEQTIDLSSYGLSSDITLVIFRVGAEGGDNVVMECDYITFEATA